MTDRGGTRCHTAMVLRYLTPGFVSLPDPRLRVYTVHSTQQTKPESPEYQGGEAVPYRLSCVCTHKLPKWLLTAPGETSLP